MSSATSMIESPPAAAVTAPAPSPRDNGAGFARRLLFAPLKLLIGVLFCTSWLLSFLVVGWTYRLMRRETVKQWYRHSNQFRSQRSFRAYAATHPRLRALGSWPNWIVAHNFRATLRGETAATDRPLPRRLLAACFQSLWQNLRVGVPAVLNTWVLTMPACLLWLYSWSLGWNISFDKVYEESHIGASLGFSGIFLFIATMYYLPTAQARHAATGNWRSFYDFKLVWRIARQRWLANAWLAVMYAGLAVPLMVLVSLPQFFPQIIDSSQGAGAAEAMTNADVLSLLQTYFFFCCVFIFPAYVLLHWFAARSYAIGLLAGVRRGEIRQEELGQQESAALSELGLLLIEAREVKPITLGRVAILTAGWTSGRVLRIFCAVTTFMLWFSFAAAIYVGMFLSYRPISGWLNMPLIQLPWLKEIPGALGII